MNDPFPIEQVNITFDDIEFAENPEPRCPVVLLLDTSGSMSGSSIEELNRGVRTFWEEVASDTLAAKRVEVAVVTFGPVAIKQNFGSVTQVGAPELIADGGTPIGEAVVRACSLLQERKRLYKDNGITYFRPWIILITDGAPTDDISNAIEAIRRGEEEKALAFFAIGVSSANMEVLATLSQKRQPLKLRGLMFREFFLWLSASVSSVSHSTPGDVVPLKAPTGWAEV